MHSVKSLSLAIACVAVILLATTIETGHCQGTGSGFGVPRPSAANVIFEPTLNFIRQNIRLMQGYVALFRSIFVGAYERPLITSTDSPANSMDRQPSPKVPPMDLPTQPQTLASKLF